MISQVETIRKRFCKDVNASINILESPYFENRLELFDLKDKYDAYIEMIETKFGSDQAYLEYYNQVKDNAIDYIKNSKTFQQLNSCDMNAFGCKSNIPDRDPYKETTVGDWFTSIDIRRANYTALVKYGELFDCPFVSEEIGYNYEKFIAQFTDVDHIIQSKYIRQVIFGNCNPKRQITFEHYLMSVLMTHLIVETGLAKIADVYSLRSDELVLSKQLTAAQVSELEMVNLTTLNIPLSVQVFQLGKIVDECNRTRGFYKRILNFGSFDSHELKCVSSDDMAFVTRMLRGKDPHEADNMFNYNGQLAKIINTPKLHLVWDKEVCDEK